MTMKNKEFSEKFGIPHSKVRRYAKDFLSPDPVATLHSGKAREHSVNEAFTIYLAEHLIANMGFKTDEAKNIMQSLEPWLKLKGFYPELDSGVLPDEEPTSIHIIRAGTTSGFFYKSVKLILNKPLEQDKIHKYERHYIEEDIMERPKYLSGLNNYVLNISMLLEDFNSRNKGIMQF